jgi:hypothetical protein
MNKTCINCGAPRAPLADLITRSLNYWAPALRLAEALFERAQQLDRDDHAERCKAALLAYKVEHCSTERLRGELHAAIGLAGSDYCGVCSIAKNPGACLSCWAVALRGHDTNTWQGALQRASDRLRERGDIGPIEGCPPPSATAREATLSPARQAPILDVAAHSSSITKPNGENE